MSDAPTTPSRAKIGAAAGLAGAAAVFALVVGVGPAPSVLQLAGANEDISGNCDEAEHAADPECQGVVPPSGDGTTSTIDDGTSTTVEDSTSTTVGGGGAAGDEVRSVDAAGAGIVVYAFEGGRFRLISATPAAGWRVDVEQSAGDEIDLDFRSGAQRVQVDIEVEDGQVRERVRFRDDATDDRLEIEDGVVVEDRSGHGGDDNSGPGSGDDDSTNDSTDDNSGPGSGDDDSTDDNSGAGSGDDDPADDDSSGRDHPEDD